MKDGLYRVTTSYLCAGFVVNGGRVVACAPILRNKLEYWMKSRYAKFVCEDGGPSSDHQITVAKTVDPHL